MPLSNERGISSHCSARREAGRPHFDITPTMQVPKTYYALKTSMVSPSARVTMAFFQVRVRPSW